MGKPRPMGADGVHILSGNMSVGENKSMGANGVQKSSGIGESGVLGSNDRQGEREEVKGEDGAGGLCCEDQERSEEENDAQELGDR